MRIAAQVAAIAAGHAMAATEYAAATKSHHNTRYAGTMTAEIQQYMQWQHQQGMS